MQWKALDNLLERIEKLEKEVFLLKPLKQKDINIPEIYINNRGTSFLLIDNKCSVNRAYGAEITKREGVNQVLDGIKKTIEKLEITNPEILYSRDKFPEVKIILTHKDTFEILTNIKEANEMFYIKSSYIKDDIDRYKLSIEIDTNPWLEEKLSNYPLS